ncbi:pyridoxamine 5'-phosphate oxidase [Phytopseudomonas dryadis]|uniref:Pyridoxine/pyridoxamine 5'-phosphate oxidase n=1 Tax=Phytopseudomonas dryadis TaxID=2487520 RepID=A0ABY1Z717_9GAMM|nr:MULTISPECIES: pyridoxamine 5'-phosphate oxidase [Pseudomonas]TBV06762.1 pyridoxamine 5'-phosphate oxidase [Pseudomonas dryadis]TBV18597.1 pyridoxamine 5'-phosphate oxidase [Pseudomonas sp. FRB 230]
MTQTLADMRRDYTREGLSEQQAPLEPFSLFQRWFADAVKTEQLPVEPNAMTLATVDADGRPHCRVLLLKGVDGQGFTFFSNYDSAKGQQLKANPFAAMTFFWPSLERQVRVEGQVERVSAAESDAYFQVRPLGSRIGAWASPQSRVIQDRAELEGLLAQTERRFLDQAPSCPPHWGGYRLLAERIEFWQGRASRLHDRLDYRLQGEAWIRQRLAP